MTQTGLANALGLTFQQVQKYERGANRISASKLYEVAHQLDVGVEWFFEDLEGSEAEQSAARARLHEEAPSFEGKAGGVQQRDETRALISAYLALPDDESRQRAMAFLAKLGKPC